jgi:hypothetical protein
MSSYHDVYARAKVASADFLSDISALLHEETRPHDDGDGYLIETPTAFIDVYLSHTLEDDGGIPYSSYPLCVTIRDRDRDDDRAEKLARSIYQSLVASGKYDCFLVYDITVLLEGPTGRP